jgi:hypothetical protein
VAPSANEAFAHSRMWSYAHAHTRNTHTRTHMQARGEVDVEMESERGLSYEARQVRSVI